MRPGALASACVLRGASPAAAMSVLIVAGDTPSDELTYAFASVLALANRIGRTHVLFLRSPCCDYSRLRMGDGLVVGPLDPEQFTSACVGWLCRATFDASRSELRMGPVLPPVFVAVCVRAKAPQDLERLPLRLRNRSTIVWKPTLPEAGLVCDEADLSAARRAFEMYSVGERRELYVNTAPLERKATELSELPETDHSALYRVASSVGDGALYAMARRLSLKYGRGALVAGFSTQEALMAATPMSAQELVATMHHSIEDCVSEYGDVVVAGALVFMPLKFLRRMTEREPLDNKLLLRQAEAYNPDTSLVLLVLVAETGCSFCGLLKVSSSLEQRSVILPRAAVEKDAEKETRESTRGGLEERISEENRLLSASKRKCAVATIFATQSRKSAPQGAPQVEAVKRKESKKSRGSVRTPSDAKRAEQEALELSRVRRLVCQHLKGDDDLQLQAPDRAPSLARSQRLARKHERRRARLAPIDAADL